MEKLLKLSNSKTVFILLFLSLSYGIFSQAPVRVKDLVIIEGFKENQLTGIGLVTGLKGQGDSPQFQLTKKMLFNFTSNFGFNLSEDDLKGKNVAAVVVTARTLGYTRVGESINVTISSIGDAKSLNGGILLQTALKGADGNVYAVAEGRLISSSINGTDVTASIPEGGIVEKNIVSGFIDNKTIRLLLKHADFATAFAIKEAVIGLNPELKVTAQDKGLVEVLLDEESAKDPVQALALIEALTVTPDIANTVIVDRKSGVIVTGGNVVIQECTVSTPALQLRVSGRPQRGSQSAPQNTVKITSSTVDELVTLLNQTGIPVGEITSVLEAIHKSGALHARLVIM